MHATVMYSAGDVHIEDVPDPYIVDPTVAILHVTRACICGSDLWPYISMEPSETGQVMGHEAVGVVEDVGAEVRNLKRGDLVVMPFASSDGICEFCHEGLPTACVHLGFFGNNGSTARRPRRCASPTPTHVVPAQRRRGRRTDAVAVDSVRGDPRTRMTQAIAHRSTDAVCSDRRSADPFMTHPETA